MPSLELPHGAITYSEAGEGSPVVLVHGVAVDGRLWREVAPRLADRHRVIALDLPLGAHRPAVAPDADLTFPAQARLVAEALDALELDGVTLVGNDSGGGICQLVAAWHPERLGRLVLTNCDAYEIFPPTVLKPLCVLARRAPRVVDAMLRGLRLAAVRTAFAAPANVNRDPELLRDWMEAVGRDPALRRDWVKILAGVEPGQHAEALPRLRAFERPVLLAWAPGDALFPVRLAERLAADLPDAQLVRLARGRAFTPLDQPERLAEEIGRFLERTGGAVAAEAA